MINAIIEFLFAFEKKISDQENHFNFFQVLFPVKVIRRSLEVLSLHPTTHVCFVLIRIRFVTRVSTDKKSFEY